ncbi:serine--tRNA ligase, mitochondrial-like [Euwallacea similis]|uniref:serine--tRNA ligase, mitochondrial-like n=1 Tax=Euwallacea similis TaxID=1736056 RepID=UPI00344BDE45
MLATPFSKLMRLSMLNNHLHMTCKTLWELPKTIQLDEKYLLDPNNIHKIDDNTKHRKSRGNIKLVHELYNRLNSLKCTSSSYEEIKELFDKECLEIPNKTHPDVFKYGNSPKVVKYVGQKRTFEFAHKEFSEIAKNLNLVRTDQLGNLSGSRSYYLLGQMAELEQALVRYFVGNLIKNGFQLVSVPDILPRNVVESCGMSTQGERTQVYTLDSEMYGPDLCLSGTSEIALAGYLSNKIKHVKELPLKLCSVSRCYRAETSSIAEERGIFRVHEFTKVEMFIVAHPLQSDLILEEIRTLQELLFESLEIHFQVLDMPPHDLGAPAYRKYDIEAWMPGRNIYGEISSCSNCTDFQSRRLNIQYKNSKGDCDFVHTLNGTACAIPRLLIALTETHQESNGVISIPQVLQKFMNGKKVIERQKKIPQLMLIKNKKNKF